MKMRICLVFFFSLIFNSPLWACEPTRIMPLGDSLTAGGYNINGVWHIDGGYRLPLWKTLTNNKYQIDFVGSLAHGNFADAEHEGRSGWRIEQLDEIVENVLLTYSPDVVLLIIGTNDLVQNFDISSADQRFEALLRKILDVVPRAHIFAASTITTNNAIFNARVQNYNLAVKNIVLRLKKTQNTLHWVDMYTESKITPTVADLTDGVHPTPQGYEKMAAVWSKEILKLFKRRHFRCKI